MILLDKRAYVSDREPAFQQRFRFRGIQLSLGGEQSHSAPDRGNGMSAVLIQAIECRHIGR
jgi:hypothetical protein